MAKKDPKKKSVSRAAKHESSEEKIGLILYRNVKGANTIERADESE